MEEEINDRLNTYYSLINECKAKLSKYDYIGVKIAMGVARIEDYSEEISETEVLRKQINDAETEIQNILELENLSNDNI